MRNRKKSAELEKLEAERMAIEALEKRMRDMLDEALAAHKGLMEMNKKAARLLIELNKIAKRAESSSRPTTIVRNSW